METEITLTPAELAKALEQWEQDAARNGWDKREDAARFGDTADYLIHTIRINRGEGAPPEA